MSKLPNFSVQKLSISERGMPENEATALATEIFEHFCGATSLREIIDLYRSICDVIGLRPGRINDFYPTLKTKIRSWQAQALWKKFDARASHKIYCKATACASTRILVIGAGPCGLRTAIEAQFLGAKVVVIEKRDKISRNNVLHLWPFVISDLKNLGAKKFYGKFCAGSIDHISIKQLQFILLKVALLLGVEIHEGVCFENVLEPHTGNGWRALVSPKDHPVSFYEFDVLVGADGKRNTLDGFNHKEFRGKLAIAITANFINNKTEAEAKAEEISGVAFIFNQSFFKELHHKTGIDLENIVYYKDETHYFVMTAKKHSLIEKGVIKQDVADPTELLASINVNTEKLLEYAREAADFSTEFRMPNLEYAVNHYGNPDVAMFDFTSMYAAEASCRVVIRKKFRLLQCLVGDSLLEPFWPTGSGCARGFLSSLDAAYAIKMWATTHANVLTTIGQRESIYRLLAQTTPENLHRDIEAYTLDPSTRYPNLNKYLVNFWQVKHLVDSDDPLIFEPVPQGIMTQPSKSSSYDNIIDEDAVLLEWIQWQLHNYSFMEEHTELSDCFTKGKVLCFLIIRYHPNLLDMNAIRDYSPEQCNELAFEILEKDLGIPRVMSASQSINLRTINIETWMKYLQKICDFFRGQVPQLPYSKMDYDDLKAKMLKKKIEHDFSILLQVRARSTRIAAPNDAAPADATKRSKKRKTIEKCLKAIIPSLCSKEARSQGSKCSLAVSLQQKDYKLKLNKQNGSSFAHRKQTEEFDSRVLELENKLFYPDRLVKHEKEPKTSSYLSKGKRNEQFKDRIKSVEQKMASIANPPSEKKPKDLLRAIGKLERSDWNVREIEKKMKQSKTTESCISKTKVPKWNKEQFIARKNKIGKPFSDDRASEEKFKMVDGTHLNNQFKLQIGERGKNRVASIAGKFTKKTSCSKEDSTFTLSTCPEDGLTLANIGFDLCFVCKQKVCLSQRILANGMAVHDSCLKCFHCQTVLRQGHYFFDREGANVFVCCSQHSKFSPALNTAETNIKKNEKVLISLENNKKRLEDPTELEKQKFRNKKHSNEETRFSGTKLQHFSSDSSCDEDSSTGTFENDTDTNEKTLPFSNLLKKKCYSSADDSGDGDDFYDSSGSLLDGDTDSPTEDEEIKKAREIRRQEVKLLSPPTFLPTDTETEMHTNSESYSSGAFEVNSATEISTDSEFDHEHTIRETPSIIIDKTHLKKSFKGRMPQATSLQNAPTKEGELILKQEKFDFQPLIEIDPSLLDSSRVSAKVLSNQQYYSKIGGPGIAASNKNFERKMRYLLGDEGISKGVMKSASTTILDTKFKRFHSNLSVCEQFPCKLPALNLNDTKNINSIKTDCKKNMEDEHGEKVVTFIPKGIVTSSSAVVPRGYYSLFRHPKKVLDNELYSDISFPLASSKSISEHSEHTTCNDSKSNSNDTVVGASIEANKINIANLKKSSLRESFSSSRFNPDEYDNYCSETETDVGGLPLTETELSDWAVDDTVSENLLNFELELRPNKALSQKKETNKENSSHSRYCRTLRDQFQSEPSGNGLCEVLRVEEIEFMDTELEENTGVFLTPAETKFSRKRDAQFFDNINTVFDGSKSFVSHESEVQPLNSPRITCLKNAQLEKEINYVDQGIYIFRNKDDTFDDLKHTTQHLSPEIVSAQKPFESCAKFVVQTSKEKSVKGDHYNFLPNTLSTNYGPKHAISVKNASKLDECENLQISHTAGIDLLRNKLKKIAEDRKKQKDLIHDLVMNRLQNKKNTNTERKFQNEKDIYEEKLTESLSKSCLKQVGETTQKAQAEINVLTTKKDVFTQAVFEQTGNVNFDKRCSFGSTIKSLNQKNTEQISKDNATNYFQRTSVTPCKFVEHSFNQILTSSKSLDEIATEKLPQFSNGKSNFRSDSNLVFPQQGEF